MLEENLTMSKGNPIRPLAEQIEGIAGVPVILSACACTRGFSGYEWTVHFMGRVDEVEFANAFADVVRLARQYAERHRPSYASFADVEITPATH